VRLIGLIEIEDAFIRKIHITKNKRRRVERLVLKEGNRGHKQKTKCNGLYQLSTEYIDGRKKETGFYEHCRPIKNHTLSSINSV